MCCELDYAVEGGSVTLPIQKKSAQIVKETLRSLSPFGMGQTFYGHSSALEGLCVLNVYKRTQISSDSGLRINRQVYIQCHVYPPSGFSQN